MVLDRGRKKKISTISWFHHLSFQPTMRKTTAARKQMTETQKQALIGEKEKKTNPYGLNFAVSLFGRGRYSPDDFQDAVSANVFLKQLLCSVHSHRTQRLAITIYQRDERLFHGRKGGERRGNREKVSESVASQSRRA